MDSHFWVPTSTRTRNFTLLEAHKGVKMDPNKKMKSVLGITKMISTIYQKLADHLSIPLKMDNIAVNAKCVNFLDSVPLYHTNVID